MLNLAAISTYAARLFGERQNKSSPSLAVLCAILCLALPACAQPPAPQSPIAVTPTAQLAPDPAPTQPTRLPSTPAPQPPIAAEPSVQLTAPPLPPTPSSPAPPIVAIPTPAAQTGFAAPPTGYPPTDVAFTQITAGKTHACGLRENGAILCWGRDNHNHGSLDFPTETSFRQISAGLHFTCALRQDSTIACWGNDAAGQSSPPQGLFSEIAAGSGHTCAIPISQDAPPALICWGAQFPNGAETLPLNVPISDIQAGGGSTCGLTPQADMACMQMNQRLTEITPGPISSLGVGLHHICALRDDGGAFCQDDNRRLRSIPPPTKFVQIAAGWHHTCGITRASRIECWGSGRAAAPGERLTAPDGEFAAITIGWRNSCALTPNGRAVCWGTPDYLPSGLAPEIADLSDSVSPAFGGAEFNAPVDIFPLPSGGLAVVELRGVIAAHRDQPAAPPPKTILDLTDAVGGSGILSAALDPQFEEFPFLYVWYSAYVWHSAAEDSVLDAGAPHRIGRLARFRVNRGIAVRGSELAILDVHMADHSSMGGAVRFGSDGMLYLGIGYAGTGNKDVAQSLDNLKGKIIRIDVRGANTDQPYRVPPDNPFVDTPGARPEIWAYGMKNPWRMDFDPKAPASLFVADVGESTREEVSIAVAGANLGWPLCEGDLCQESLDAAIAAKLTSPAVAYGRDLGCAVIGGVTVPWLDDGFIFGDICSRRVWLLERNSPPDGAQDWRMREIANLSESARNITAFGAGADGSVYVLPGSGPILRLHPDPAK